MPIIIPTGASTFGDSTKTEGGRLGKYILAQVRADANLEWVGQVRARLVKDELKYVDFKLARPRVKLDYDLWSKIEKGVGQASIIVIDPKPVEQEIRQLIEAELNQAEASLIDDRTIIEMCAAQIVANTPIAYLPTNLAHTVPWGAYELVCDLGSYTPGTIRAKIGGSLRNAQVFAARAHALFDLKALDESPTTDSVFKSPLAPVVLAELVSTVRTYDVESPATLGVLNEAANAIAAAVRGHLPDWGDTTAQPLVREIDSRAIDELQAGDIAAGWARDVLEVGNVQSLGANFERVWSNGVRVK